MRDKERSAQAGVNTMADLQNQSRESIMRMRNMGKKGMEETVEMMQRFGIELVGE